MRKGKKHTSRARRRRQRTQRIEHERQRRRFLRAHPGVEGRRKWATMMMSRWTLEIYHPSAYVQGTSMELKEYL
jgi:hypothetical protein